MSIDLSAFSYLIKGEEPDDRKSERLEIYSNFARYFAERGFGIEAGQLCLGNRQKDDETGDSDLLDSKQLSTSEKFKSAAEVWQGGNHDERT